MLIDQKQVKFMSCNIKMFYSKTYTHRPILDCTGLKLLLIYTISDINEDVNEI